MPAIRGQSRVNLFHQIRFTCTHRLLFKQHPSSHPASHHMKQTREMSSHYVTQSKVNMNLEQLGLQMWYVILALKAAIIQMTIRDQCIE